MPCFTNSKNFWLGSYLYTQLYYLKSDRKRIIKSRDNNSAHGNHNGMHVWYREQNKFCSRIFYIWWMYFYKSCKYEYFGGWGEVAAMPLWPTCISGLNFSANRHQLIVPRCRLNKYGRRDFSIAGPTFWNSLPDKLRDPACGSNSVSVLNSFLTQSCL